MGRQLIKRLDDDRYAIKVTPRKPTSKWSDINRRRRKELKATGRLAPRPPCGSRGKALRGACAVPELPAYVARAIKTNSKAWRFFQQLEPHVPA